MVFTFQDYPYTSKSGVIIQINKRPDYQRLFLEAHKSGHEIFISNIFSNQYLKNWSNSKTIQEIDLDQCFIVSDMSFTSNQFQHISPTINKQSFSFLKQNQLETYIKFIIQYCGYLGIRCLTIPYIQEKQQILLRILNKLEEQIYKAKLGIILSLKLDQSIQWENYVHFRRQLNQKIHIDLIMQFTSNLPVKNVLKKWMSQKISFFSFSTECYVMNKSGHAVLPLPYQNLTKQFFKLRSGFLLHILQKEGENLQFKTTNYFKYIIHLFQIMAKNSTKRQISARGLYDYLLHPLQPYADNLESQTYSIFQFDAPKYEQYAVAILLAFQKINVTNRNIVVYYLGSGRGALIPGIMAASKATKKKVTIYAVQKNPFPLQSLKRRIKQNKWSNIVKIKKCDIKEIQFEQKPDIFFSELLGGIGDNQLSPECLKWAQDKLQDKQNLICIPSKYSSYIKPVCYPSVHRDLKKNEKQGYFTVNYGWHYSPFKSQQIWNFVHPLPANDYQAFNRNSINRFKVPQNITIHGFLGSFDCNLYQTSYFSIVPQTQTIDMYSWFPLYFAFFEQQQLIKGQQIQISTARINIQKRVWYEWSYKIYSENNQVIKQSITHNNNGCQKCIYL